MKKYTATTESREKAQAAAARRAIMQQLDNMSAGQLHTLQGFITAQQEQTQSDRIKMLLWYWATAAPDAHTLERMLDISKHIACSALNDQRRRESA